MNISIFSKLECKGGSEWRNYEYLKGFLKRGHSVRVFCYRHYNPLLKDRLTNEIGADWQQNLFQNMDFKIDCRENEILLMTPVDEACFKDPNWLNSVIVNKQNLKKVLVIVNWGMTDSMNIVKAFDCPVIYLCANTEYRDKFREKGLNAEFIHTPISNDFFNIDVDYDNICIGRHSRSFDYKFSEDYVKLIIENPQYEFKLMGVDKKYARRIMNLPNVKILKEFSMSSPEFLQNLGILLQINKESLFEMSPRVVAEGMAAGIPVIARNQGGAKDMIVNGENGFLYDTYEDILKFLKELTSDKELRIKIGRNAKNTSFRNHNILDKITELESLME